MKNFKEALKILDKADNFTDKQVAEKLEKVGCSPLFYTTIPIAGKGFNPQGVNKAVNVLDKLFTPPCAIKYKKAVKKKKWNYL